MKSFRERGIVKAALGTVAEDDDAENKSLLRLKGGIASGCLSTLNTFYLLVFQYWPMCVPTQDSS